MRKSIIKNDDDGDDLNDNDVIVVYTTQRNMALPLNACLNKLTLGHIQARLVHPWRDLTTWHKLIRYVHVSNKTKAKNKPHCRNSSKSNRKTVERGRIDTPTSLPHIYITITFNVINKVNVRMRKTKV